MTISQEIRAIIKKQFPKSTETERIDVALEIMDLMIKINRRIIKQSFRKVKND